MTYKMHLHDLEFYVSMAQIKTHIHAMLILNFIIPKKYRFIS